MKFLDRITDTAFKTAKTGETIFFPWGVFGRGYIVPSDEERARARRFYKTALVLANLNFFLVIAVVIFIGRELEAETTVALGQPIPYSYTKTYVALASVAAIYVAFLAWFIGATWRLTARLPQSSERMRFAEWCRGTAHSYNWPTVAAIAACLVGGDAYLLNLWPTPITSLVLIGILTLVGLSVAFIVFAKLRYGSCSS